MPIFMGIHFKPIGHGHSTSLDFRVRGNDGGMFFSRKRLSPPETVVLRAAVRLNHFLNANSARVRDQ